MKGILCSPLVATLPFGSVLADTPKLRNAKVTLVYQHELPNVPDKSIKGVLVGYGRGGYSHEQSFSELPGDCHGVSANASNTEPAKLLAVFVVHTDETELTIPFGNGSSL